MSVLQLAMYRANSGFMIINSSTNILTICNQELSVHESNDIQSILYLLTKIQGTNGTSGYLVLDVWQAGADLAGGLRWPISPRHWEIHSGFSHCSTGPNLPNSHTQPACPLALVWHLALVWQPELSELGSTKFRQDPTINLSTSQDFFFFY